MEKSQESKVLKGNILATFKATALTVLLQECIDNSKGTKVWSQQRLMRARALYQAMEKYMLIMYKSADDSMVVAFHTMSNILERVVDWLGEDATLDEFTQKLDKLSEVTEGDYRVVSEVPSIPDDTDICLAKALEVGWIFNEKEMVWRREGYRSKTTAELYDYIKNYYFKVT